MRAIPEVVEVAKSQIRADIEKGYVPATVGSFVELHDYVDANEYGIPESDPDLSPDAMCQRWNTIQDAIDAWIKAGRP